MKIKAKITHYEVPFNAPSYVRNPCPEKMTVAKYQARQWKRHQEKMAEEERKRTNPTLQ
jgi:hypothetical protein